MVKRKPIESRWQAFLNTTLVPAVAQLPSTVRPERRNVAARDALLCRIYGEFEEMQGLSLTPRQAARLFGIRPDVVSRILERLTDARVLRKRDDQFARDEER